jgi:hypothetical protein
MAELAQNQTPAYRAQFSRVNPIRVREKRYGDRRDAGTARKVAGTGMRVTGKAVKTTGRATMRGGAALSATGVGAVVGVPMVAAGAAMTGAGAATDQAGRAVRQSGKRAAARAVVGGVFVRSFMLRIIGWFMVTWLWLFQIVLTFILIYGFSFSSELAEPTAPTSGGVTGYLQGLWDSAVSAVTTTIADEIAMPMILFAWGLCMLICLTVLFATLISLQIIGWSGGSSVKPLNTATKEGLFLAAVVGYSLPLVQVIPWGAFWVWHLRRHGTDSE